MKTEQLPFDKEFIHWLYVGHHPFIMYPDVDGSVSFSDEVRSKIYTIEDMYEIYLAHKGDSELRERFYNRRRFFFWMKFSKAFRENHSYAENPWSHAVLDALTIGSNPYRIMEYLIQALVEKQQHLEDLLSRTTIPQFILDQEAESKILKEARRKKYRKDKEIVESLNKPTNDGSEDN